jgi:hypothetical protein
MRWRPRLPTTMRSESFERAMSTRTGEPSTSLHYLDLGVRHRGPDALDAEAELALQVARRPRRHPTGLGCDRLVEDASARSRPPGVSRRAACRTASRL